MSRWMILSVVLASSAGCPVKNVGDLESGPAVADASDEAGSGEGSGDSEASGGAGSISVSTTSGPATATGEDESDTSHTAGAGEPPPEVTAVWENNSNGGVTLRIAYAVGFDLCGESIDFDPSCATVQQWGLDLDFDPPPLPGEYDLETLTGFASVLNPLEGNGCSGSGQHVLGTGTLRLDAVGDEIQGGLVDTILLDDTEDETELITVDFVAPFCPG